MALYILTVHSDLWKIKAEIPTPKTIASETAKYSIFDGVAAGDSKLMR